jgi:hypothetical protein
LNKGEVMEAGSLSYIPNAEQGRLAGAVEYMRSNARYALALGGTLLAGAGLAVGVEAIGGGSGGSGSPAAVAETAGNNSGEACNNYQAADLTSNPEQYNADAFLPKTTIDSPATSQQEVTGLFAQKGAVTDPVTLAAIMATVVQPAEKGTVNDPNYDYGQAFRNYIGNYATPNSTAARDCKTAYDVLIQVGGYNASWAKPGDKVSQFKALRDGRYNITDAEVTKPQVVQGDHPLSGTEFVLRDTTKGLNGENLQGFASVLVTSDGEIYLKGVTPSQTGKSPVENGKQPQHVTIKRLPNGKVVVTSTGGGGGTSGTSNGTSPNHAESPKTGPVREHNKQGANPGPNHGNGGNTGTRTGTQPSPNTGGETTPTTTTPSPTETTPTTTTPTTPTTTTPTTPTTPTTTATTPTTTTPNKTPAPCDPNTGAVC